MASHGVGGGGGPSRRSMSLNAMPNKKKQPLENGSNEGSRKSLSASSRTASLGLTVERTVKRLRLSKALTVPENTTLLEACRRMAARRVDALLLTDSNALLCGILTDKDITTRVIAHELNLEDTPVSKVMTRNPVFVLSDALAVEALQKMVQGKFRHLPVVENGEVIALLDIAKCLYDAIARLERAAEKGKAIVAAVEGVEKHWGTSSGSNTFIETLRERMFRPSLSTIIPENSKIATVSPTETVLVATKKMLEFRTSSAVVTIDDKPRGIITSRDILMRVTAQNLPPQSTLVEKVMTPNPECATIDTPIVDALHTMHDGKFLHIPVVDRDGKVVAVVDVLQITHAAVSAVSQVGGTAGISTEATNSMMQKFWDSAMALTSNEDEEDARSLSEGSLKLASEGGTETGRALSYPLSAPPNTFAFKIQDKKGRMHRFTCETHSLADLIAAIIQRVGDDIDPHKLPQLLYEDEDQDKVVLASDSDLATAVDHARSAGWKGLRLHLDYSGKRGRGRAYGSGAMDFAETHADAWASAYSAVAAGAALVAGLGVMTYMKRS
ncbi:CBS domain-containing protein CBSCBSPB5-like isoform X1 [Quercus lobata]|uniref:CBS domain-containing protein CBSCBSPB5-like isoform X1 n=1 Tax=Quercus lobata TaxID=97700 RepID=UPI0012490016|nr:CBS domain-containing protein CBSCBSPB5-like isoform X1 [Quercus lobata]